MVNINVFSQILALIDRSIRADALEIYIDDQFQ
jgi:hypothetical protein